MSIAILPDAEVVVAEHLRNHPEVGARVAARLPNNFTQPWIRVTQLDATNVTNGPVEHLVNFLIQFECYAGSGVANPRDQASSVARTARAALGAMPQESLQGVVATRVAFTSHARIPDEAFNPWRERYILTAEVYLHAA